MATVKMYIDKFGKDVIIDEADPLVAAQRAKPAEAVATPPNVAPDPALLTTPATTPPPAGAPRKRRGG